MRDLTIQCNQLPLSEEDASTCVSHVKGGLITAQPSKEERGNRKKVMFEEEKGLEKSREVDCTYGSLRSYLSY